VDPTRIRELLTGLACPICGGTRGDTLLIVIDAPTAARGTVRVQCVRCHLFWTFALEGAFAEVQDAEYIESIDAAPSVPREPIGSDEMIDVHTFLQRWDGSVADLWSKAV